MAPRKFVYWGDHLKKTAPSTSDMTIETEKVERGAVFCIQFCSFMDETSKNKVLEIGIKSVGEYFPIDKRKASTDDYSVGPAVGCLILVEGEQLYGKVYTPTKGDKGVLVFNGELFLRE